MFNDPVTLGARCLNTDDIAIRISKQFLDLGLQHDSSAAIFCLCNIFKSFHQAISDSHAREPLLPTMSSRHGMSSKARNKAEIDTEFVLAPVHSWRTLMAQDPHKVWSAGPSTHCVCLENFGTVSNTQSTLSFGECTVDAAGGFGAVSTEEWVLVNHQHVDAMFENCVRCRETTKATADNDHLLHGCVCLAAIAFEK